MLWPHRLCMVFNKGLIMKTLDQIIDQIHQEQEQNNLKVVTERNLYMEELEKKYSSEDFLASHIFDRETEVLFKGLKKGFMHPELNAKLLDYMSPKALDHLSKFKEALETICPGSYIKWEQNFLTSVNARGVAGEETRESAEAVLEFNSIDPFNEILESSFYYSTTSEGGAYWEAIDDFLRGGSLK